MGHNFLSAFPGFIGRLPIFIPVIRHGVSLIILLLCNRIRQWVGDSVVSAFEKPMGLVLTAIEVEMILCGVETLLSR